MWRIQCTSPTCVEKTRASDIVDLINNCRDADGWFRCWCGQRGYIEKSFAKQEGGNWDPFLKGAIPLGNKGDTYQPFVFLVGDEPDGLADQAWFSYYKDLRPKGGRLKLGYGPGGPPVLSASMVSKLLDELARLGCT